MALQWHKLFASGCVRGNFWTSSRLSVMSQCRGLQNYPGICVSYSPFRNGSKYGNSVQVKFREAGETYRITPKHVRVLKFMVQRDHCFLGRANGEYKNTRSCLCSKLRFGSFSSEEYVSRRFFSVKATQKYQIVGRSNTSSELIARDGKDGGNTSGSNDANRSEKQTRSIAVRSSNSDGCLQVAVSMEPVKKTASKSSLRLKPKEQPIGGGKMEKNSESYVSAVAKCSTNKQDTKTEGKKKPQKNKTKELQVTAAPSGDGNTKLLKQASRVKKSSVTKVVQPFRVSEIIIPNGGTPPPKDKSAVTHNELEDTKKSSIKKKKPSKEVTVRIKPKAPRKDNSPAVVVEVNSSHGSSLRPLYPPTEKSVVVVESVTKAKVIQGYLGNMFEVLPSFGHVRDLAGRSGSVRPDDNFSVVWEVPTPAWKVLKSIKAALNGAKNLILASDPDREGEAIAWHIMEMLLQQEALDENIAVARVVFHEITESSIKSALQAPRDIDANLVHAYLARRALDYLIGFNISPLLWRKLPGCQSAGRVQSAALSLICDRETEIDEFKPQEYWTVEVEFNKEGPGSVDNAISLPSRLTQCDSKKIQQLTIGSSEEANNIEQKINLSHFAVIDTKRSKTRKNPPPPYITSSLQQDAANKLHFTVSKTMSLAQKLYEGVKLSDGEATGLITYMRTDGVHVSDVAAEDINSLIIQKYGGNFAPASPRKYFKKVKNAQEAHEAIRPTNIRRLPSMLTDVLDKDSLKLYTLIWSRTMACQMEPSLTDLLQVDIGDAGKSLVFRCTCSRIGFPGYQEVYKDLEAAPIGYNDKEEGAHDEVFKVLSTLKVGDSLQLGKVELKEHSTQPPPRYSEGALIKKLEELGIGRPSTYASTIKVLVDRKYVTVNRALYPEFRGRMVSAFLSHHFSEVTEYSFTANMETELDNVSAGMTEWKGLLKDYWTRFSLYCDNAGNVDIRQVEKMLEEKFGNFLFASLPNKSRTCPSCSEGCLIFKVSRFGSGYFIGCDQHPKCKYIAKAMYGDGEDDETPQRTQLFDEPKLLGLHPSSGDKVLLKKGPYGFYVQLGEDRKGYLPKRASASKVKDVHSITLEDALDLLRYPVELGNHPEDGEPVFLRLARHGFAIKHRRTIAPVPKNTDIKEITLAKALKFLLSKDAKRCGRPKGKPKQEDAIEAL